MSFRAALRVIQPLNGGRFMMTALRSTGKVKNFNDVKGYGFITNSDGSGDIFVHQTSIKKNGFRSLRVGEDVEFDIEVNPHDESKRTAKDVTGPNGADVLGGIRPPRPDGERRERNRF